MFCCLHMASDLPTRNTSQCAGDKHPSTAEQTTQYRCISRSLQGYPMPHPLSRISRCASTAVTNAMVAGGDQFQTGTTSPSAALHWRTQQQTAPSSTAHISGHSEMHIFTLLTLSPQLIDNRASENSSYTADRFNTGQMWWTTHTTSFKGQDSLTTREILFFSYTDETFGSLMRKWSDVTLSSSWISSINAFCTTETSRELSATTAVPHSHCCVSENESLQFPYSCCRQRAEDYSLPSSGKWLESNTETTCTEL